MQNGEKLGLVILAFAGDGAEKPVDPYKILGAIVYSNNQCRKNQHTLG